MLFLDQTLPALADNLALDEALLQSAEAGGPAVLRVWQWPTPAVVLGAGGRIADDVHEPACIADGVPLARRASGGGTVLLGKGCLLYSLVLAYARDPALTHIPSSYCYLLKRIASGLHALAPNLAVRGSSDLVWHDRKISGNAQQRKRTHFLQHGTLLYDFDAASAARYLKLPPRQPEYRRQRNHGDFLANLPADANLLTRCLRDAWGADTEITIWPEETVRRLVAEKYGQEEWVRGR
jgi:lipoate---protein ligase